jgi:hypothetical protein
MLAAGRNAAQPQMKQEDASEAEFTIEATAA